MSAANQIDYIEFQAGDIGATKQFFEQLFGWKFTDYGPDYTSFEDGRIAGGFSRADKRSTIATGGILVVFIIRAWRKCANACSISAERSRPTFSHSQVDAVFISPSRAETNAPFGRKRLREVKGDVRDARHC
jgi:hypothetical protein